jgi:hypothetical protein
MVSNERSQVMRSTAAIAAAICVATGAWPTVPASAQRDATRPEVAATVAPVPDTIPVVMSISGAISVGAYQAGVNWAILHFLRRLRWEETYRQERDLPVHMLRTVTGASAGNINTLLWALEWCTSPPQAPPDPTTSLFWKVWVGAGLNTMLPEGRYDRRTMDRSVFDRTHLRRVTYPPFYERLKSPDLEGGCELPVGITLTRTHPGVIRYEEMEIETQRFATIFRAVVVEGALDYDGDRLHFLQLESSPEEEGHFGKLLRLLPRDGRISTRDVLRAAEASAAFPLALAPVQLEVWYPDDGGKEASSVFLDGGIFDNNPVNLALGIYRHTQGARAERETARVLYVNPFRYRGELGQLRALKDRAPPATGGIPVLGEFLGGFVSTARQYELQLLARERDARERSLAHLGREILELEARLRNVEAGAPPLEAAPLAEARERLRAFRDSAAAQLATPRESLHFTSRMHPIYGEHLNAFAGFLGRPLREFDFFVGTYDGIHFLADAFLCGTMLHAGRNACVRREMADLILDQGFTPEAARRLLAVLYDREHHPDRSPAAQAALAGRVAPPPPEWEETDRILLALFRAAASQFAERRTADCQRIDNLLARRLCVDGITPMLEAFRDDTVRWVFPGGTDPGGRTAAPVAAGGSDSWSRGTGRMRSSGGSEVLAILRTWQDDCRQDRPGDCRAEDDFVRLVENPKRHATVMAERILDRMEAVERGLKADGLPHYAGLMAAGNALFHTTSLRSRRRTEWSPSRPATAGWHWNLIPYSVGGPVGHSGWEIRWRPAYNFNQRFAVTAPITRFDDLASRFGDGRRAYWGGGLGVAVRGPHPAALILWPEVGIEASAYRLGGSADTALAAHWSTSEVYSTFMGGFIRLGWRVEHRQWFAAPHQGSIAVALADVGGLAYWVRRTTCREDGRLGCPR